MSEKYKLIKEYPGSPELGTILHEKDRCYSWNNEGPYYRPVITDKNKIEDYPEFWEKVVEKDYKILQMKNSHGNFYSLSENEGLGSYEKENHTIHSVKRLSDGKVFTVGDKVKYNGEKCKYDYFIIDNFYIVKGSMLARDKNCLINEFITEIHKVKEVLFTTEDGVEIFEGDKYFELALTFKPQFREAIYECTGRPNINYDYNTLKGKKKLNEVGRYYFSSKEAAEEFVLMNKPCLSINEVMNVAYNPTETFTSSSRKLKELVKQKIKNQ